MQRHFTLALCLLFSSYAFADFPTEHPWPEVTYHLEKQTKPMLEEIHTIIIDLSDHKPLVRVSRGGEDPDGDGPWTTTLMTARKVAEREDFDIVVNGDFFNAKNTKDAEGRASGYVTGLFATPLGPAVTDGATWATPKERRPCLVITNDGLARIEKLAAPPKDARQIVAGNQMLVAYGKVVPATQPARHPRTCVGVDQTGTKLYLLVVDGRNPLRSMGMTYAELSEQLVKLGCFHAINLDGGGSTTLAMRDPDTKELKVLNNPSDHRERAVANVLGIRLHPTTQPSH